MQDDQVEQTDEAVEPTAEDTTSDETSAEDTGAEAEGSGEDQDLTASVDQQAAESDGSAAEQAAEVPDGASATIAAAQQHIDNLDMDAQRKAAEQAAKNT